MTVIDNCIREQNHCTIFYDHIAYSYKTIHTWDAYLLSICICTSCISRIFHNRFKKQMHHKLENCWTGLVVMAWDTVVRKPKDFVGAWLSQCYAQWTRQPPVQLLLQWHCCSLHREAELILLPLWLWATLGCCFSQWTASEVVPCDSQGEAVGSLTVSVCFSSGISRPSYCQERQS